MTDNNNAPALRPVTVEVPGDVLLDQDGVPVAVGDPHRFSGLLYGWGDFITSATDNGDTDVTAAPEQDNPAHITDEGMEILRGLVATAEADATKWKALSRRNEDRLKAANAARDAAREDATKWKRRADHNSAVLGELRRQNANLIARLAGKETR